MSTARRRRSLALLATISVVASLTIPFRGAHAHTGAPALSDDGSTRRSTLEQDSGDIRRQKLGAWMADPFVQAALRSGAYRMLTKQLARYDGYLATYPRPRSGGIYVTYWVGRVPAGVPTASHDGHAILHKADTEIRTLEARASRSVHPLSVEQFQAQGAGPQGPMAPGVLQGVGPGGAIHMQNKAADGTLGTFVCSTSYLFQDPITATYYLGTAGHCLLDEGVLSSAENPEARSRWVDVCVSDCVNNWVGLGDYVRLQPSGGYHPVAWAEQRGIGQDFGFIELPASFEPYLRPWMWFWGGPTRFERPTSGDPLAHYGFGIGAGQAFPTQGRLAVTLLSSKAGGVAAAGWVNGGDSGSAFGTAFPRTDDLLLGDGATGALTHAVVGVGAPLTWGTDIELALDRAQGQLGFRPVLVLEDGSTQQVGGAPPSSAQPSQTATPTPTQEPSNTASPTPSDSGGGRSTTSPSAQPTGSQGGDIRTTIAADASVVRHGRQITLSGAIDAPPDCEGPFQVDVSRRRGGTESYEKIATVDVSGDMTWTYTAPGRTNASYIARAQSAGACEGQSSVPTDVLVKAKLAVQSPRSCRGRISGGLLPARDEGRITLQRRTNGTWRRVGSAQLSSDSRFKMSAPSCGSFRVVWKSDDLNVGTAKRFTVRR